MAETLIIPQTSDRQEIYQTLLPQLAALTEGEPDLIANLANITAALKGAFGFFWIGFYLTKDSQLVLGPFQGPIACTPHPFRQGRLWSSLYASGNNAGARRRPVSQPYCL